MYEFPSAALRVSPRHEGAAPAPLGADGQNASLLLDLGEGMHVLASEIIAVQALPEATDFRRHFRKTGDPCATVFLRGGQLFDAFRDAEELRVDWERSLRADRASSPRAHPSAERVA